MQTINKFYSMAMKYIFTRNVNIFFCKVPLLLFLLIYKNDTMENHQKVMVASDGEATILGPKIYSKNKMGKPTMGRELGNH